MSLEGKYFGFEFSADYTQWFEWSALAIFQVLNWKLEEVFHPCDKSLEIGEWDTEMAIQRLKELWARELFSTFRLIHPSHNEEILWLTVGFDWSKEDKDDQTRYEYKWLCDERSKERENRLKEEHGIELKRYIKK